MKKIVIFGAGISGLTVAHELLERGFTVVLVEKDSTIGGMARSRRENNNVYNNTYNNTYNGVPSEHSWRGYAPFYINTYELMRRIPDKDISVYDNLAPPINFFLLTDEINDYHPRLNVYDYLTIGYYGLKYLLSNNRRDEYYSTRLVPLFKDRLSRNGYNYFVEYLVGPGLGMEKKDVSYGHYYHPIMLSVLNQDVYTHTHVHTHTDRENHDDIHKHSSSYTHRAQEGWHVMDKPTSEAWFDPWIRYLKSKGLILKLSTELIKINSGTDKILSCTVQDSNGRYDIEGDEYVLAINPFNAEQVLKQSQLHNLYEQHRLLNENSISNQISFRLGFNKEIQFPEQNIAFVMPDSEFNITWYPQEKHWNTGSSNKVQLDNDAKIKSLWSGTIINPYNKGSLYTKKGLNMDKKQLMDEIVHQIFRSKSFQKLVYDSNGFYLNRNDIDYKEIWYEWEIDQKSNSLKQRNRKWVNSIYNERFRPGQRTEYDNLHLSGAHTQNSVVVWSMEGAVESGKIVANLILDRYNEDPIFYYDHDEPFYIKYFQSIDDGLYMFGLPNIVDLFILFLIFATVYTIYWTLFNDTQSKN